MMSFALALFALASTSDAFDTGPNPLLMQHPTINASSIVFEYADDLWSVPRSGGRANRLTTALGAEFNPYFSPDGKWIAFSGNYDGNVDVYVMPADGGEPKRLTAYPGPDIAQGWTPDGKSVVFESRMLSNTDNPRLFTVPVTGGYPSALPFPSGSQASFSPDGKELAYVPGFKWETAWKRYRGGQAYRIWIGEMSDSKVQPVPRKNSNDSNPMWMGGKVYFLSDREGPVGLYSYDIKSGRVSVEIKGEGFDLKSATAGPDEIVYERFGSIGLFDPKTRDHHTVNVTIDGDFPEARSEFKNLLPNLQSVSISPSGSRAVVAARGWILTVPASKGDTHLLDDTQGLHRREPAWSPDGRTIAYITDSADHQQMGLWDVESGTERCVDLGEEPAYYDNPVWSPDSSKIAYTDYRRNFWILDVKTGKNTKVDSCLYMDPTHNLAPAWSPDSKWLAYSRDLDNHMNAIFLYSMESGKSTQITDGMASADSPVFDLNGKYLYFYASTDVGQSGSWLDLSSLNQPNVISSIYAVVLHKDDPNPLQPESDEEKPKEEAKKPQEEKSKQPDQKEAKAPEKEEAKPQPKGIDLDDIESRIIALPMPADVYAGLVPGPADSFFAFSLPPRASATDDAKPGSIEKFSFSDRKASPFASGVTAFSVTPDGSKALIGQGPNFSIVPTAAPPSPGQGHLDLTGLVVRVSPVAEWNHMFYEIWRNEQVLFYSPILNGISADTMEKRYAPFLKGIRSRDDLNYLFDDMLGELCVGHEFPGGGDIPRGRSVAGGLLGADYEFADHRYKFKRIYTGERWNPGLYAPLAQPGVNAKVGEFLLAIDGKDLTEATDVYQALEGKAGKQVKIKIGPTPDGKDSREVVVVPVASEFALRQQAWEEDNRRYVLKQTNGRAGYVHVPDTGGGGWEAFNRYYYAQVDKEGIVIDERFNHGGLVNDFMIHEMKKTLNGAFGPRYNKDWPTPGSAIFGPKIMLANEGSGSGGDMFPWLFRHNHIGKIVGKRTWGGLIAAAGFSLVDGGQINAPDIAFHNLDNGTWDVENWGVDPDIEVELDPYLWRQGHDAQLDRAIEELNKELDHYKAPDLKRPPYPDRTKLDVRY